MVDKHRPNSRLISKVAEVYNWLNSQIEDHKDLAGRCYTCGKCCDFESFDHKLFVTTPELIYLAANLHSENLKPMNTGQCPYNSGGKCSIYEHRFSGCRIFSCKGDTGFQSGLSEKALKKFKSLCSEFQISYCYTDLATALNEFVVA
jgi:Fe-S-cluster containining protein